MRRDDGFGFLCPDGLEDGIAVISAIGEHGFGLDPVDQAETNRVAERVTGSMDLAGKPPEERDWGEWPRAWSPSSFLPRPRKYGRASPCCPASTIRHPHPRSTRRAKPATRLLPASVRSACGCCSKDRIHRALESDKLSSTRRNGSRHPECGLC